MRAKTSAELTAEAQALNAEAHQAAERAAALHAEAARLRYVEREEQKRTEREQLSLRLYRETGEPLAGLDPVQHNIIFEQAWRDAHSDGLGAVEERYGVLAQMVREVLDNLPVQHN